MRERLAEGHVSLRRLEAKLPTLRSAAKAAAGREAEAWRSAAGDSARFRRSGLELLAALRRSVQLLLRSAESMRRAIPAAKPKGFELCRSVF